MPSCTQRVNEKITLNYMQFRPYETKYPIVIYLIVSPDFATKPGDLFSARHSTILSWYLY